MPYTNNSDHQNEAYDRKSFPNQYQCDHTEEIDVCCTKTPIVQYNHMPIDNKNRGNVPHPPTSRVNSKLGLRLIIASREVLNVEKTLSTSSNRIILLRVIQKLILSLTDGGMEKQGVITHIISS